MGSRKKQSGRSLPPAISPEKKNFLRFSSFFTQKKKEKTQGEGQQQNNKTLTQKQNKNKTTAHNLKRNTNQLTSVRVRRRRIEERDQTTTTTTTTTKTTTTTFGLFFDDGRVPVESSGCAAAAKGRTSGGRIETLFGRRTKDGAILGRPQRTGCRRVQASSLQKVCFIPS